MTPTDRPESVEKVGPHKTSRSAIAAKPRCSMYNMAKVPNGVETSPKISIA